MHASYGTPYAPPITASVHHYPHPHHHGQHHTVPPPEVFSAPAYHSAHAYGGGYAPPPPPGAGGYHQSSDMGFGGAGAGGQVPYTISPYQTTGSGAAHAAAAMYGGPGGGGGGAGGSYAIHGGGPAFVPIYTDDASTKLSDRVRRRCFNCCTTDTSTWRRSSLNPGKVVSPSLDSNCLPLRSFRSFAVPRT